MDAAQREYDRFGPWAVAISDADPPPPLFEPHLDRSEPVRLAVKIPRAVERRNARPGMDLYDFLLCLYEHDLVILERLERGVHATTCRYQDVKHLRMSRSLLDGHVRLSLPDGDVDLPYNAVSEKVMQRVVDLVRERYGAAAERARPTPAAEVDAGAGQLSFCFERLLQAGRRRSLQLLAVQGTVPVNAEAGSALRRFMLGAVAKRLLESLHLTNGRELIILSRGQDFAFRWDAVYRVDTLYVPAPNVRDVSWESDRRNGATRLVLRTDGGPSRFVFAEDNPTIVPYTAYLSSLASAARSTTARSA